jgi:hypothetical protein
LASGELALDTRLRDLLRTIAVDGGSEPRFGVPAEHGRSFAFECPALADEALFAAETSVIPESDGALWLEQRAHVLERRIGALERSTGARLVRRLARPGR